MQLLSPVSDSAADPSVDLASQALLDALPPVMRFVRHHMRSYRNKGLSLPQFRTLCLLVSAPSVNLSAVSDFLGTSLPTASRIVTGLVDKGLVARQESRSDRRQVELVATSRGAAIMESAKAATREKISKELASLGPADVRTIARAMGVLHSVFTPSMTGEAEAPQERKRATAAGSSRR